MYYNICKYIMYNFKLKFFFQILSLCLISFESICHIDQAVLSVINMRLLLVEIMVLLSQEPFMKSSPIINTAEHK